MRGHFEKRCQRSGCGVNELLGADRDTALFEYVTGDSECVDDSRKARVHNHLEDHFNDFGWLAPDVQCSMDMYFEGLRLQSNSDQGHGNRVT